MVKKPFTKRERQRLVNCHFGYRGTNDWGSGDLPAPWAEGDVVRRTGPNDRLNGMTAEYFVVTYAPSIDEGDAWYFRVSDGIGGSDRLHVSYAERCTWDESVDWMSTFELVETSDPDGLALREKMLADGWEFAGRENRCPHCGKVL